MAIHNSIFRYARKSAVFWIPIVLSISQFIDIHNSVFEYPRTAVFLDWNSTADFWVSRKRIMDIKKLNYGYPPIELLIVDIKSIYEYL